MTIPAPARGGWQAWMTGEPCLDDVCNIGHHLREGHALRRGLDGVSPRGTQEVLVCGDKPMVLAVANSDPTAPGADPKSISAFIFRPGQLITLDKGIWHDACRSAEGDECYYYFLAHSLDPAGLPPGGGRAGGSDALIATEGGRWDGGARPCD